MNNEEKKAIETIEELLRSDEPICEYMLKHQEIDAMRKLLNLIEKQAKEIEDKKEEIYSIAKTNYILGQTDERSQWYKKINEKIEEYEKDIKDFVNTDNSGRFTRDKCILTYYVEVLKELIGKEE